MKLSRFPLLLGAALTLTSAGARAQTAAPMTPAAPTTSELTTARIQVHNVPANLMAYWLDPNHQPMPRLLQASIANGGHFPQFDAFAPADFPFVPPYASATEEPGVASAKAKPLKLRPGNANGPLNLQLPAGIVSIASADPSPELLVRGTKESVQELRALVAKLDVPLQRVEVEVQFVQIALADLKQLGLSLQSDKLGGGTITIGTETSMPNNLLTSASVGLAGGSWQAKLGALIAQNKVKIITAPRVTATNGLTARLVSDDFRPFMTSPSPKSWGDEMKESWIMPPGFVATRSEIGIACTPLIYKDFVQLDLKAMLQSRVLNLTATVKDGQTFAASFPYSNPKQITVLFITARTMTREAE